LTNKTVTVRAGKIPARAYEIKIGAGNLATLGEIAKQTLPPAVRRAALISNERVYALYGEMVAESLRRAGYDVATWLMGEGERYKSFAVLGRALDFLSSAGLERSDAVIALGGGVVGDLAGFAAATHLRGISFLQVPTTFLSQIDSSVGGKTGINTRWGKNLVGAFHQPRAVLIDVATHDTLPPRELTAGWCEAVKQGAVGGRDLFVKTTRTLAAKGEGTTPDRLREAMIELIAAQCAFKASIVAGDEREELGRQDHRSRKVLNFGHTVGHALEAVTDYRRFKHGEAVGCGMLVAGQLSLALGLLADFELESLRSAIRATGRLPRTNDLNSDDLIAALAHDKKSVAGHLKWILLEKLGRARIVNGTEVSPRLLRSSLREVLELKA
jgi:3-dehydroquinate synthase